MLVGDQIHSLFIIDTLYMKQKLNTLHLSLWMIQQVSYQPLHFAMIQN